MSTFAHSALSRCTFAALLVVAAACGDEGISTRPMTAVVSSFSVTSNENNVLSALAVTDVRNADSARIVYWTGSEGKQATPFATGSSVGRIVVVGLHPETRYNMVLEAVRGATTTTSDIVSFTTGALDAFLAASHLTGTTPLSGGYVMAALGNAGNAYITVFDSTGNVAWYRKFPGESLAETNSRPTGTSPRYSPPRTAMRPSSEREWRSRSTEASCAPSWHRRHRRTSMTTSFCCSSGTARTTARSCSPTTSAT
jgi:hypothetical protein